MRIHELVAQHTRQLDELRELAILGVAVRFGLTASDLATRMVREVRDDGWAFGRRETLVLDGRPVFWTWYADEGFTFTLHMAWSEPEAR